MAAQPKLIYPSGEAIAIDIESCENVAGIRHVVAEALQVEEECVHLVQETVVLLDEKTLPLDEATDITVVVQDRVGPKWSCGPAGEWKRRIAEQLSAVFFQGGLEWVKHENETIEVVTEEGTFEVGVNEEKFAEQSVCWARGCDCEQAKNPAGRVVLFTLAAIGIIGLMSDTLKLGWEKFAGKKPAKHVQCKKGHRLEEKPNAKHVCDICGKSGTHYQCGSGCPYDLCKVCYKSAKKKLKAELEAWYEKHPEEKKKDEDKKKEKKKKGEKGDRDDSDEDKKSETEKSEGAEGVEGEKAESSKPDEDKTDDDKSEAEEKES